MNKAKNTGSAATPASSSKETKHKGDHSAPRTSGGALAIGGDRSAKLADWLERVPSWLKTTTYYALIVSGAYWILAGWFSTWGDVAWPWGRIGLTALGAGLIYLGMIIHKEPTSETSQAEKVSDDVILAAGEFNMRCGKGVCLAGIVLTGGSYLLAWGGGTVFVWTGAIAIGAVQFVRGYTQVQSVRKKRG